MSDYLPQCSMDNYQNIQTALNEKITSIEQNWTSDLDETWSQSTSSASNSPGHSSGHSSECETFSLSTMTTTVVNEADSTRVDRTPPWMTEQKDEGGVLVYGENYPHPMVLPKVEPGTEVLPQTPISPPQTVPEAQHITPPPVETTFHPEPAAVKKRSRTQFTTLQLLTLEKQFSQNVYITRAIRSSMARELSLSEKQIKIWFQNRRMKENKIYKVKASGGAPKVQNRVAATAVKNLQRLAEKQHDQNIVSRLMSQRQVTFTQQKQQQQQQAQVYSQALGNFVSGEEVHNSRSQYVPPPPPPPPTQYVSAPPPYPGSSQLFPQDTFYEQQRPPMYHHHLDLEPSIYQYDVSSQYPGFGDHPMDQHVQDHLLNSLYFSDIQNSSINWGTVFDRQLTA